MTATTKYNAELRTYGEYLKNRSPLTVNSVLCSLKGLFNFMNDNGIEAIDTHCVQAYVNSLSPAMKPSSIRLKFGHIRHFLRHGDIESVKFSKISLPRKGKRPENFLDAKLLKKYLQEVKKTRSYRMKVLLVVLPFTGLRISEVCGSRRLKTIGLTKDSIVRVNNVYMIRVTDSVKFDKTRDIPMHPVVKAVLLPYARDCEDHVLFDLNSDTVREKLKTIGDKINAPWLCPHSMRHTFISILSMKGAPVRDIQELVGHASSHTTNLYMHTTPESKRGTIDKFTLD